MSGPDFIKLLEEKLSVKTSWGRNEVLNIAKDILIRETEVEDSLVFTKDEFIKWMDSNPYFSPNTKQNLLIEAFPEEENVEKVEVVFSDGGFDLRSIYKK